MESRLKENETMQDFIDRLVASFDMVYTIAPIAYWYENLDANGSIRDIHFSNQLRKMLGYNSVRPFPDKLDTLLKKIHPDDVKLVVENSAAVGAGKINMYDVQYRIKKADGDYLWCKATGKVVRDSNGRNVGVYGVLIDISAQMEAAAAQRELAKKAEQTRNDIITKMAGGESVYLVDFETDDYIVIYRNDCLEERYSLGGKFSETLDKYLEKDVHRMDREKMKRVTVYRNILKELEGKDEYSIFYRDISSGSSRWYRMRASKLSSAEILFGFGDYNDEYINDAIRKKAEEDSYAMFVVNLDSGLLTVAQKSPWDDKWAEGSKVPYCDVIRPIIERHSGAVRSFYTKLSNLHYVRQLLAVEDKFTYTYQSGFVKNKEWVTVTGRVVIRHEDDGSPAVFVLTFSLIDALGREKQKLEKQLHAALDTIRLEKKRSEIVKDIIKYVEWSYNITAEDEVSDAEISGDIEKLLKKNNVPVSIEDWTSMLHPDDRERAVNAFRAAITDHSCRTPYDVNYRMIDPSGKYNWFRSAGRVTRHADGSGEFFGILVDINEQAEAE